VCVCVCVFEGRALGTRRTELTSELRYLCSFTSLAIHK
jgi:hypothetical protein